VAHSEDNNLVGVCVFGFMSGNPKGACVVEGQDNPKRYRELRRVVLLDSAPKNSESRFIAWCLRWLRDNTNLLAIISFADSAQNHIGVIYQAGNWKYTGESLAHCPIYKVNGEVLHTRTLIARYGTEQVEKLRALGLGVETKERVPKFRYIYPLREGLLLKAPILPYPKKGVLK